MNKKLLVAFVFVGVLALGLTGAALAAPADPPVNPEDCPMGDGFGRPADMAFGEGVLHETVIELYADALGLSVEELETRLEAGETLVDVALDLGFTFDDFKALMADVHVQVLDTALADGVITQDQYDWMIERGLGSNDRGRGFGPQDRPGLYNFELKPEVLEAVAGALGLSSDDLQARLDAGETMREIVEDLGFSQEDFADLMLEARLNWLDEALANGTITQEQYDNMLDRIENGGGKPGGRMQDGSENGAGFGGQGMKGGQGGPGGKGGKMGGFGSDS